MIRTFGSEILHAVKASQKPKPAQGTYDAKGAKIIAETLRFNILAVDNFEAVRELLDWVGQTVHRAHHDGSFEDCQKNTCQAITTQLKGIREQEAKS